MAKDAPRHLVVVARTLGNVEQVTIQLACEDSKEIKGLLKDAHDALQPRIDEFQKLQEQFEAKVKEAEKETK